MNILFQENKDKYCLFPIQDDTIYQFYKKQISCFWTVDEIDLCDDIKDFESLTEHEQFFIKMILSFFASADGIVNENLDTRFINDVQLAEAKATYSIQNAMETIHSETYSLLIDTYIKDKKERNRCFSSIIELPIISKKLNWGLKWINSNDPFSKRIVAFAILEGLFFSGAFCSIFWLKKRGLMKGLCFANELISRDEGLHTEYAVYLYRTYCDKLSDNDMYDMMKNAVQIETEFIVESLPCRLIGMNSDMMIQYIKYVADRLLTQLGYSKLYNMNNPFAFMEMISIEGKTNFFEKRVSEYSLASGGDRNLAFEFHDDF
jgi:ribonucleotide reductase beta subunit family protein with ferritin-like domain